MDLQLTNKNALVTGSTAGIGFAIASLLAQERASVVVNGRTQGRVEEAVQRIRQGHKDAQVTGIAADLGTSEGVAMTVHLPGRSRYRQGEGPATLAGDRPDRLPLANLLHDHFLTGMAEGRADLDWAAMALSVREAAGLSARKPQPDS